MTGTLTTRPYSHNTCASFDCVICGGYFRQNNAAVALDQDGEELGDICPDCLQAGAQGALTAAHKHAARLRKLADRLDDLAGRLPDVAHWATLNELRAAEREARASVAEPVRELPTPATPRCYRCREAEATGWAFLPAPLERELREQWGVPDDAALPEATVNVALCRGCYDSLSNDDDALRALWWRVLGLEGDTSDTKALP